MLRIIQILDVLVSDCKKMPRQMHFPFSSSFVFPYFLATVNYLDCITCILGRKGPLVVSAKKV